VPPACREQLPVFRSGYCPGRGPRTASRMSLESGATGPGSDSPTPRAVSSIWSAGPVAGEPPPPPPPWSGDVVGLPGLPPAVGGCCPTGWAPAGGEGESRRAPPLLPGARVAAGGAELSPLPEGAAPADAPLPGTSASASSVAPANVSAAVSGGAGPEVTWPSEPSPPSPPPPTATVPATARIAIGATRDAVAAPIAFPSHAPANPTPPW
jgi:hypothetical protein